MKIGRNDPCPCGSGRKYKHCCLDKKRPAGFDDSAEFDAALTRYQEFCESLPDGVAPPTLMEFLGHPNGATESQKFFTEAPAGHEFADAEEVEQFVRGWTENEGSTPLADFEGLSPKQMHRILHEPVEDNGICGINHELSNDDALKAELIDVIRWLMGYFADHSGSVKVTGTGSYNRALCKAYCRRYPAWFGEGGSVPLESSLLVLETAHDVMISLEYVTFAEGKEWLTTEGVDIYARNRWSRVYLESIEFVTDKYDWKVWLHESLRAEHFDLVQHAAVFLLYLLRNQREGTIGAFVDRVFRAFPEYIRPAQGERTATDLIASATSELFFGDFCAMFGLVEVDGDPYRFPESWSTKYRVAPLFESLFRWKL